MNDSNFFEDLLNTPDHWFSKEIGRVNSNIVNVRVMVDMETEFHTHNKSDEFFMVLEGKLEIDIEEKTIMLQKGETYTVTSGSRHRARVFGTTKLISIISENA